MEVLFSKYRCRSCLMSAKEQSLLSVLIEDFSFQHYMNTGNSSNMLRSIVNIQADHTIEFGCLSSLANVFASELSLTSQWNKNWLVTFTTSKIKLVIITEQTPVFSPVMMKSCALNEVSCSERPFWTHACFKLQVELVSKSIRFFLLPQNITESFLVYYRLFSCRNKLGIYKTSTPKATSYSNVQKTNPNYRICY